jgi:hypothetical protein
MKKPTAQPGKVEKRKKDRWAWGTVLKIRQPALQ